MTFSALALVPWLVFLLSGNGFEIDAFQPTARPLAVATSIHSDLYRSATSAASMIALYSQAPASSASTNSHGGQNQHGEGMKKKKGKKNGNKNKNNKNKKKQPFRYQEPKPRTVLFDYDANTNMQTASSRLQDPISCEHFAQGECAGCTVNEKVSAIPIIESAKMYFSSTSIRRKFEGSASYNEFYDDYDDDETENFRVVIPSPVVHWRTQAKLAVAPKSSSWSRDGCIFGLYKRASHSVSPIPDCKVHHPSINRAVELLSKATDAVATASYSRNDAEGGLRYVQFQVERTTGKICLTLVWAAADIKRAQPGLARLVKELMKQDPELWHGIWCHCNDGIGNNIFSRDPRSWHRIKGPEFVREPLPTTDMGWLYFSPLTFRQGNMDGFDVIATDVAKAIPGGSKVCELYAGVGYLGLSALAHHAQPGNEPLTWLRCSDENPSNQRCFTRSIDSLPRAVTYYESSKGSRNADDQLTLGQLAQMMTDGVELESNDRTGAKAKYIVASASRALRTGQALGASVLVVDPPRKGLEEEVLQELCKPFNKNQPYVESSNVLDIPDEMVNWTNDVDRLIYVSCGFDALARDCDALLSSQAGWMLESAAGYVLFPGSDHVETVCIFNRKLR
eukprot:CAMPEP_0119564196 /NCGR_PEP_ID=MMETSP1352-20130426/26154_1 /TAXON_ID=265584 /ORGANISM="Stauroneis constricta, Strain CCMP1120" /LENGTH=621 /DNA_ID=CAMNT_0007612925 /DNA_START=1 /DNA_END=1866 /DNA_ORIENTATION=+